MSLVTTIRRRHNALLLTVLLVGLLVILLLPTMKPLRSVEMSPENTKFVMGAHQVVARNFRMPAGRIGYVLLWVGEGQGNHILTSADYATLKIRISSPQTNEEVRTADNPLYILREGKPALAFHIQTLTTEDGDRYDVQVQQFGSGTVELLRPLRDQIKEGEEIIAAIQVGQRKNWITSLMDRVYGENLLGNDISMYLHRGQQIVAGENPYSCVLEKGACIGYPAHFPGMYWIASGFVLLGVDDLPTWAQVWRPIAIGTWLAVGIVLVVHLYRRGQPTLAVAALGFWLFNRWSLDVLRIVHTDFLGVLLLLMAVIIAHRRPKTAALLLGASLAIKQIALLAVPFFLLMLWRKQQQSVATLALLTGLVVLIPVLTLLPFLIDDAPATIQGIFNPIERPAQEVHGFASSFAQALDVTDTSKVFLMVFLIGILYIAAYRKTITLAGGILMIFLIMISFTHVLYNQYIIWMLPFIPLVISEAIELRKRNA